MSRRFIISWVLFTCVLCLPLTNGDARLLGYWSFDDKNDLGKDFSPNGNHGVAKGGAAWTGAGKVGGGLLLDWDADSFLQVPHDDNLNVTDQVTLMCWVKFTEPGDFDDTGRDQSLIWKNGPPGDKRFLSAYALRIFRRHTKFGSFAFDANMAEGRIAIADPVYPDQGDVGKTWYHVAGVADGAKIRVYVNGKEKVSDDQKGAFQASDQPLTIGFDLRAAKAETRRDQLGYVDGIMDEVVILDKALTQAEVQGAMETGEKGNTLEEFQPVFAVQPEGKLATQWAEIKARR
ncbi:MAG: LamG domain-containing protein [Candidatus Poribacteria bacterium]|nr:LamG domain-containing protein [Candidatus Poribacteria bacterium]